MKTKYIKRIIRKSQRKLTKIGPLNAKQSKFRPDLLLKRPNTRHGINRQLGNFDHSWDYNEDDC